MSDIAAKWGEAVARRGFAQIPNYLMYLNMFLDEEKRLSPVELLILLQLVGTWWRKGDLPFPSMATLGVRCGVSLRQIQRSVTRLEALGLIQRVGRRKKGIIASNAYDLSPLVSTLDEVAKAFPNEFPRKIRRSVEAGSARPALPEVGLSEKLKALEPGQTMMVRFQDVAAALNITEQSGEKAERLIRKYAEINGCHLNWVWTDRHDPIFEKMAASA